MKPNADITVYNRYVDPTTRSEAWIWHQVKDITWEDSKAANVIQSGLLEADRYTIYIPFTNGNNYLTPVAWLALEDKSQNWTLQLGDVIVRGLVDDEISSSLTISDLKRAYDSVARIRSVDRQDRGSLHLHHWQVGCT